MTSLKDKIAEMAGDADITDVSPPRHGKKCNIAGSLLEPMWISS